MTRRGWPAGGGCDAGKARIIADGETADADGGTGIVAPASGVGGVGGGAEGVTGGAARGLPQFSQNALPTSFSLPQKVHLTLALVSIPGADTKEGAAGGAGSVEGAGAGGGATFVLWSGTAGGMAGGSAGGGAGGAGGGVGTTGAAEAAALVSAAPQLSQNADPSIFSELHRGQIM